MLLLNRFNITEFHSQNDALEDSFVLLNLKSHISEICRLKHIMCSIHSFTQQMFIEHLLYAQNRQMNKEYTKTNNM